MIVVFEDGRKVGGEMAPKETDPLSLGVHFSSLPLASRNHVISSSFRLDQLEINISNVLGEPHNLYSQKMTDAISS